MADYILTPEPLLDKLLSGEEMGFPLEALTAVAREIMEPEVANKPGLNQGERSPERPAQRDGYREGRWDTRAGSIILPISKPPGGFASPPSLKPRRRSEQVLIAIVCEAYVKGCLATREVEDLAHALSIQTLFKAEVSRTCAELDQKVEAFRGRSLLGRYPYLWLDACYKKVRAEAGRVARMAPPVAYGVAETGEREVLGLAACESYDHAFWKALLESLSDHGLTGVKQVCSDAHGGLTRAISGGHQRGVPRDLVAALPGALSGGTSWSSCRRTAMAWCPLQPASRLSNPTRSDPSTSYGLSPVAWKSGCPESPPFSWKPRGRSLATWTSPGEHGTPAVLYSDKDDQADRVITPFWSLSNS